ncbi:MAG TPA: hypothetical protein IAA44_01275 [Candidatus Blautia avistercoris]|uniref:hypothetical protein n=1 Tax=Blautia sp. An249 TaxID=1965603 RepID=UPI0013A66824|nr:hypothetical protein [Blautia sp. An249]HIY18017.1 hypothetical protein [Candidatus Blautia avistercoris]
MEYTETYQSYCPKHNTRVVHTVIFKKRTCSRIQETVLHFTCSQDSRCKECQKDYP